MIYLICVILTVIIFILGVRIHFFQKSLKEINEGLEEILAQRLDTNALLTVSSGNRHIRSLAAQLNNHLQQLRREHLRYENGDRELKEAITNISHDLRTPLTAINGYLDLLHKYLTGETITQRTSAAEEIFSESKSVSVTAPESCRKEPAEKALHYVEIIQNRTETMKQLTAELFRYSIALSVREEKAVLLSLNKVLEESLISFYSELEQHDITPVIHIPEKAVMRTLDESSLTRIFNNILSNAVKYSDGDLCISLTEEGILTFSNKAAALTPVTAAKLFDRFFTVETVSAPSPAVNLRSDAAISCDAPERSTGLGLSIAKLLTERMGGTIEAEYKNGELYIIVQFP